MSTRQDEMRDRDDIGRGARRDVRDTGRNIRDAGGDIISNWCGLWSNLLSGVSEAISPRSRTRRSSNVNYNDDDRSSGLFFCDGGEFRVACGPSGGERDRDDDTSADRERQRPSARYSDRDREVEINT
jgi:hypothetical protein